MENNEHTDIENTETLSLNQEIITQHIESLLFVANQELTIADMNTMLSKSFGIAIDPKWIDTAIESLNEKYESDDFVFHLMPINSGYRLLTKKTYHRTISHYVQVTSRKRLSNSAMEILAIIAYKQPVTKVEVESIRGSNCDYGVQKLLEKELIEIVGRAESVGKPLLYGTSKQFMDHFGLKSIADLPKLSEVVPQYNQIGEMDDDDDGPIFSMKTNDGKEQKVIIDISDLVPKKMEVKIDMTEAIEDFVAANEGAEGVADAEQETNKDGIEEDGASSVIDNIEQDNDIATESTVNEQMEDSIEEEVIDEIVEEVAENEEEVIEEVVDEQEEIIEEIVEEVAENEEEVIEEVVNEEDEVIEEIIEEEIINEEVVNEEDEVIEEVANEEDEVIEEVVNEEDEVIEEIVNEEDEVVDEEVIEDEIIDEEVVENEDEIIEEIVENEEDIASEPIAENIEEVILETETPIDETPDSEQIVEDIQEIESQDTAEAQSPKPENPEPPGESGEQEQSENENV